MVQSAPLIDSQTGALDVGQILTELVPLAKLVGAFAALALGPLVIVFFVGGHSIFGALFTVLAQFIIAIGTAIVLIYVVARGIQLAEKS